MLTLVNVYNVEGQEYNVWIVIFFTVLYSVMGHILLYSFEEKRKELKVESKDDPTELTEAEIAMHSLLLRGLNTGIPVAVAENKLFKIFNELINDDLIHVHVIGDYNNLTKFI